MAVASVNSGIAAVQILAPGNRNGFVVTNTDANALYLLMDSGTPSSTNYTVSLATGESFGVNNYDGELRGVWAGDGTGVALVTSW